MPPPFPVKRGELLHISLVHAKTPHWRFPLRLSSLAPQPRSFALILHMTDHRKDQAFRPQSITPTATLARTFERASSGDSDCRMKDMDAANSFYDKLLASLDPATFATKKTDTSQRIPTPPPPLPPTPAASETLPEKEIQPSPDPSQQDRFPATSPPPPAAVEIAECPHPSSPLTSPQPSVDDVTAAQASSPAPKSSAALEAELRQKLLDSKKKKHGPPPPPSRVPQGVKRPHRGSPVFTAVPLDTSPPPMSLSPTEPPHQLQKRPSLSAPKGRRMSSVVLDKPNGPPPSLPPKPPKREPFALRISVPFPYAPGHITLQTDRLPLDTPITSILDLFGRRSEYDSFYFPLSEPAYEQDPDLPPGQRFFRDSPRRSTEQLPGWRDLARNGLPGNGPGMEARQTTLEDVHAPLGASVVECELVSTPPQPPPVRDSMPNDEDGMDEDEEWGPQDAEEWGQGPPYDASYMNSPWTPGWQQQQHGGYPGFPMQQSHWGHQHINQPPFEEAPKWIPGHADYNTAGWMYGFHPQGPHPSPNHPQSGLGIGNVQLSPTGPVAEEPVVSPPLQQPPLQSGPSSASDPVTDARELANPAALGKATKERERRKMPRKRGGRNKTRRDGGRTGARGDKA